MKMHLCHIAHVRIACMQNDFAVCRERIITTHVLRLPHDRIQVIKQFLIFSDVGFNITQFICLVWTPNTLFYYKYLCIVTIFSSMQ